MGRFSLEAKQDYRSKSQEHIVFCIKYLHSGWLYLHQLLILISSVSTLNPGKKDPIYSKSSMKDIQYSCNRSYS